MKALIIENEYDIPEELREFLKDNPDLFSSVDEQIACRHRPLQDLGRHIAEADAIIVMSTFMYTDQLEQMVQAFAKGPFSGKDFKFYIYRFMNHLNGWNIKRADGSYKDDDMFTWIEIFMANMKSLIMQQEVYSIEDGYGFSQATPVRVLYSKELDFYYLTNTDPQEEYEQFKKLNP